MRDLVFLTYSFKDIRRVRRLREALWRYNLRVWPNKTLMPGTPAWQAEVHERLAEALCVVAVLSKDATLSTWVHQAVGVARDYGIPVLPVVVDGEAGHILLVETDGEDWFDLRWSRNYASEVRAMVETIQRLAAPAVINVEVI